MKHRIKTIAGLIAVIGATAGMVVSAPAASAFSAPPVPAGALIWLVNENSGKCLTIAGGGTGDNVYANQYTCDFHPSRIWYLVDRGNNNYWIRNYNSGKCLTIAGGGTGNNIYANQYTCDGHPSRLWYFADMGYARYHIKNWNSDKCLTIAGGGTGDNIYANQYTCDSHAARKWYFIRR